MTGMPGLARARVFVESARQQSLDAADAALIEYGCPPDEVTLQMPASVLDELLVDLETADRERQQLSARYANALAERQWERLAFAMSLVGALVLLAIGGSW